MRHALPVSWFTLVILLMSACGDAVTTEVTPTSQSDYSAQPSIEAVNSRIATFTIFHQAGNAP